MEVKAPYGIGDNKL